MVSENDKIITSVRYSDKNRTKRYSLKRKWGKHEGKLTAILFNPKYAGLIAVDKSTMICINQAIKLGCEKFELVNLYSSVSKEVSDLEACEKIYEEENFKAIRNALKDEDLKYILIGWGEKPGPMLKNEEFKDLLNKYEEKLIAFRINRASMQPKHPSKGIIEENADVYKVKIITTRIHTIKFEQGEKVL